jgi:hypothetical protein
VSERVAVVGAGIGGLSCALALAGRAFDVTLYERDVAASEAERDAAAIAQRRRGVPQAVHPHFFMGRLREGLRAGIPSCSNACARPAPARGASRRRFTPQRAAATPVARTTRASRRSPRAARPSSA